MVRIAATLACVGAVLLVPAIAAGQDIRTGVGGDDQYVDAFPTATGSRPTSGIGTDGTAGGVRPLGVTQRTAERLAAAGPDGQAVLGLTSASAPRSPDIRTGTRGASDSAGARGDTGAGASAGSILADVLGGGAGGLGILLPIGLVAVAGGCIGAVIVGRRR